MLTDQQLERYSRNILLSQVGGKGQKKLLAAKVLIIGAGGLGTPAAQYLAAAGVGTIGIADADIVDRTNLQRQSDAPCFRCIFTNPPPAGSAPTCGEAGVLGPVVGLMGTLQAIECLKYLLGIGRLSVGRLLILDAELLELYDVDLKKRADCPVCSVKPEAVVLTDGEQLLCENKNCNSSRWAVLINQYATLIR
ncbi:hypothetical protein SCACP_28080 [Sporomusa carbonis]|uniref:HesA/MoeB/ThiF family protein n=1 Tax=Sporomusa carbonis TaxID=3076075 RepID=UPI003A61FD58